MVGEGTLEGAPSAVAPVFVETCQIFPPAETEYA